MAPVTVVGSFVVGLTLRAPRFPVAGETVLAHDFDLGPGGKGSNQAVQVARMGVGVEFVSVIGTDDFARIATDLYSAEGVGTAYLASTGRRNTGVGFIILDPSGENRILLDPGTNDLFTPEHVESAAGAIAGSKVVMTQLEIPAETAVAAMRVGRQAGVTTILNPAPVRPLPREAFAFIDVMTPNQSEARVLLGLEPDDPAGDAEVCAKLLDLGVGTVILTRGAQGATLISSEGTEQIDPFPVDVTDTTGAGDAYSGTLAASLAQDMDLVAAARRAAAGGALACTKLGVIPALPRAAEVDALVEGAA